MDDQHQRQLLEEQMDLTQAYDIILHNDNTHLREANHIAHQYNSEVKLMEEHHIEEEHRDEEEPGPKKGLSGEELKDFMKK